MKLDVDRDNRETGFAYLWLRQAKPYAGETYGWHTSLIDGTEVAIAFDGGDPDRPYIAYALHDSAHPDHVTRDNHTRNILRTPAKVKPVSVLLARVENLVRIQGVGQVSQGGCSSLLRLRQVS